MFGRPKSGQNAAVARPASGGNSVAKHPENCTCGEEMCKAQVAASKALDKALESVDANDKKLNSIHETAKKMQMKLLPMLPPVPALPHTR